MQFNIINLIFGMVRRFRLAAGLVLLWLLAAGVASAQQWKIGAHGDTLLGGRLERAAPLGAGGQLIYNFTDIYSLEAAVSRYQAEPHGGGAEMDITSAVLTARVHFSPLNRYAALYGGAGVGVYAEEHDADAGVDAAAGGDDSMRVRPHVALGLDWRLAERWELFADYRFTFMHLLYQDNFNHGLLRFGVNYGF